MQATILKGKTNLRYKPIG